MQGVADVLKSVGWRGGVADVLESVWEGGVVDADQIQRRTEVVA